MVAALGRPERQQRYLDLLRERVTALPWVEVVVVIGSLASGRADGVSDVDLLVGVHKGAFAAAWRDRERLRVTGALYGWDHWHDGSKGAGTHKWLTADAVLVEVLLGEATSGIRLAPPWRVLAGDPGAAGRWPPRPPIPRSELSGSTDGLHPVEVAYDDFKARLRAST
ncbi:nucleotidyltransferase domain-containing protein [Virgisporangium ochraceum]|uniref:nucleotidyltransferase domain-containing protein n=1 Tax=Virgisporangium ochraceum TaxID=65505 RepID=UPI001942B66C|nr:nucleotidyltransferase domain-containing protein [Virgisporangium ochraceum]